jgi:GxxExxY protein
LPVQVEQAIVCVRLCTSVANLDFQPPAPLAKPIPTQGNEVIFNPCHRETVAPIISHQMDMNDLTYQIRGAIFEVNKVLGPGFLEKVYEKALMVELKKLGLYVQNQVPIQVNYKGEIVGEYFADLVVERSILIELKAVDTLRKIHEAQLLNYLKATSYPIGLFINFYHEKAEIKRFLYGK